MRGDVAPRQDDVAQQLLVNGRKFEVRAYAAVVLRRDAGGSGVQLAAVRYHDGHIRRGIEKMNGSASLRRRMITNSDQQDQQKLDAPGAYAERTWTFGALEAQLAADGSCSFYVHGRPALRRLSALLMQLFARHMVARHGAAALLADKHAVYLMLSVDVLLDTACRPWLIDLNDTPDMVAKKGVHALAYKPRMLEGLVDIITAHADGHEQGWEDASAGSGPQDATAFRVAAFDFDNCIVQVDTYVDLKKRHSGWNLREYLAPAMAGQLHASQAVVDAKYVGGAARRDELRATFFALRAAGVQLWIVSMSPAAVIKVTLQRGGLWTALFGRYGDGTTPEPTLVGREELRGKTPTSKLSNALAKRHWMQRTMRTRGLAATDVLFIDDSRANLDALDGVCATFHVRGQAGLNYTQLRALEQRVLVPVAADSDAAELVAKSNISSRNRQLNPEAAVTNPPPFLVSLFAGMVAGALGVMVAYPLDSIKTKMQACARMTLACAPHRGHALRRTHLSHGLRSFASQAYGGGFAAVRTVFARDGVGVFYAGVSSTMAGQAVIKGVLFVVFDGAKRVLLVLPQHVAQSPLALWELSLAAALAGFSAAFVVTPVERVKVVMQAAQEVGRFASPAACMREIIAHDGVLGLLTRGLLATLAREVPAYLLYLITFEVLKAGLLEQKVTPTSPLVGLVGGAGAGIMAWLPVYPIDVVKTQLQTSVRGDKRATMLSVATTLWRERGPTAFCDGLMPKLARAVVNHAVTFVVYEQIVTVLSY